MIVKRKQLKNKDGKVIGEYVEFGYDEMIAPVFGAFILLLMIILILFFTL